jgi:hypothetical protein
MDILQRKIMMIGNACGAGFGVKTIGERFA